MMEFYMNASEDSSSDIIVKFKVSDYRMLLLVSCANIIDACKENNPQTTLKKYVNWADHGFTNALLSQVEFVYNFMSHVILKDNYLFSIFSGEKQIIVEALKSFQQFKTELCNQEEKEHGKGWGTGTPFYKKDWTDIVPQIENYKW